MHLKNETFNQKSDSADSHLLAAQRLINETLGSSRQKSLENLLCEMAFQHSRLSAMIAEERSKSDFFGQKVNLEFSFKLETFIHQIQQWQLFGEVTGLFSELLIPEKNANSQSTNKIQILGPQIGSEVTKFFMSFMKMFNGYLELLAGQIPEEEFQNPDNLSKTISNLRDRGLGQNCLANLKQVFQSIKRFTNETKQPENIFPEFPTSQKLK